MSDKFTTNRQIAVRIAESVSTSEGTALGAWAERLLSIKSGVGTPATKARQALAATFNAKTIWPAVKVIGRQTLRIGWDERKPGTRVLFGGFALGAALFGGQGAGIAALGTAIGVPLWVVFGAGASFLAILLEELSGRGKKLASEAPPAARSGLESQSPRSNPVDGPGRSAKRDP